ncbi:MAG: hypothetical protein JNJ46_12575 [Myxococcales bacterium]|nr:hypothetical protein [Myxococcales bacterium]
MNHDLPTIGPGEFVTQLGENGKEDAWFILVLPDSTDEQSAAVRLAEEIHDTLGLPTAFVNGTPGPEELVIRLHQAGTKAALIYGAKAYIDAEWRHLDLLRKQLEGGGIKALLLTASAAEQMQRFAPHLSSFVGAAIWQLNEEADYLAPEEVAERLSVLRSTWQKDDDAILEMAKAKTLPPDPEFAQWLLLLGRGDLL